MKTIKQINSLKGKRVLLRLDLNVPIQDGIILNDFRIKKSLPTIEFLQKGGARIIILSHIGREKNETLKPVFENLKQYIKNIVFCDDVLSDTALEVVEHLENGGVVMMENLRQHEEEKNNDEAFAQKIASLGDLYVNEAFANSHREHASIVGIPKFLSSYAGILFENEVKHISESFDPPQSSIFIIGGNKLPTKLPFIKKGLKLAGNVFVGGAIVNNFFKEKGLEIGKSFVVECEFGLDALMMNEKLILPVDVTVENKNGVVMIKKVDEVLPDDNIKDVGKETISFLKFLIEKVDFVLVNGPLGAYEKGFAGPTEELLEIIAKSGARSIIGGGDTTALVNELGIEDKFSFVSTGGGAMLQFLIDETLPGIEALDNQGLT